MTTYQFSTDDDDWNAWKNTVPRSKSLEQRLHELMDADAHGRVLSEDAAEAIGSLSEPGEDLEDVVIRLAEQKREQQFERAKEDPAAEIEENTEMSGEPNVDPTPKADDPVTHVVDLVSDNWADTEERMRDRRAAARAVLQHAVDTGDAVSKANAIEQFLPEHAVDEQGDDTWWRKNIRPVLKAVGKYSQSEHGYLVEESDLEEFVEGQN